MNWMPSLDLLTVSNWPSSFDSLVQSSQLYLWTFMSRIANVKRVWTLSEPKKGKFPRKPNLEPGQISRLWQVPGMGGKPFCSGHKHAKITEEKDVQFLYNMSVCDSQNIRQNASVQYYFSNIDNSITSITVISSELETLFIVIVNLN